MRPPASMSASRCLDGKAKEVRSEARTNEKNESESRVNRVIHIS